MLSLFNLNKAKTKIGFSTKDKTVMDMMQVSLSQKKPVSGGFKITPLRGLQADFLEYRELVKLSEYISDEYCLVCAYFQQLKGHFGTCQDLPFKKPYDGAKKGTACNCWRLKTKFIQFNIEQKLPEKPVVRINWLQRKPHLGSYVSLYDLRKIKQKPPYKHKSYCRIDDYSYPKCNVCGGDTIRAGHAYSGAQYFKCKGCGHKISVDRVITPKPHRFPKQEYIQSLRPLRYVGRFYRQLEKSIQLKTRPIIDFSLVPVLLQTIGFRELDIHELSCPFCKESNNFVKVGVRHTLHGDVQRYLCKQCGHKFTSTGDFKKVKATPKALTTTLDLYSKGVSLRKIAEHLKMFEGVTVTYACVRKWIRRCLDKKSIEVG